MLAPLRSWLACRWWAARLRSADPQVRQAAVNALGRLGPPAVAPLAGALADKNEDVAASAAAALAATGDLRAVGFLLPHLSYDRAYKIRQAADTAVQALCVGRGIEPLFALRPQEAQTVVNAILVPHNGDSSCVRDTSRAVMKRWAEDARLLPLLATALRDTDTRVRRAAADIIDSPRLRTSQAVPPLLVALGDSDSVVRSWAADALGNIGDNQAVDALITLLRDGETFVRVAAARSLKKLGDVRALEELLAAYERNPAKKDDSRLRDEIAGAVETICSARGLEPILSFLAHNNPEVRAGGATLLGVLRVGADGKGISQHLKDGVPAAADHLLPCLHDAHPAVRRAAVTTLGHLADPGAVDPVLLALRDEAAEVRAAAAGALGELGDARGVEPLCLLLKDGNNVVRSAAAKALGRLGDARGWEPLRAALNDESFAVRWDAGAAVCALAGVVRPPERAGVVGRLQDLFRRVPSLRDAAVRGLSCLGDERALPGLLATVPGADDPDVMWAYTSALSAVLRSNVASASEHDLRRLAAFGDLESAVWVMKPPDCYPGWDGYDRKKVDCADIRQTARQELVRRGLKP